MYWFDALFSSYSLSVVSTNVGVIICGLFGIFVLGVDDVDSFHL